MDTSSKQRSFALPLRQASGSLRISPASSHSASPRSRLQIGLAQILRLRLRIWRACGLPFGVAHACRSAQSRDPSARCARSGFRLKAPARHSARSRLQSGSKCNEALSEDLWPLDPFESAPMRATSSGLSNSTLDAIRAFTENKRFSRVAQWKSW